MAVKRQTKPTTGAKAPDASRPADQGDDGLFGRLQADLRTEELARQDRAEFAEMQQLYIQYFQPANEAESRLVDEMCEGQWRLRRIPWIESGLYALALWPTGKSLSGPRLFTTRELERAVGRLRRYESGLLVRFERSMFRLNLLQGRRPARAVDPQTAPPASGVTSADPGPRGPGGWTM